RGPDANERPALIEERRFLTVRPEISNSAGELVLEFGNDDFPTRAECRGLREAGKHRRPVFIVMSKLVKGRYRNPVQVFRVCALVISEPNCSHYRPAITAGGGGDRAPAAAPNAARRRRDRRPGASGRRSRDG